MSRTKKTAASGFFYITFRLGMYQTYCSLASILSIKTCHLHWEISLELVVLRPTIQQFDYF
jgi:hypothetical protein